MSKKTELPLRRTADDCPQPLQLVTSGPRYNMNGRATNEHIIHEKILQLPWRAMTFGRNNRHRVIIALCNAVQCVTPYANLQHTTSSHIDRPTCFNEYILNIAREFPFGRMPQSLSMCTWTFVYRLLDLRQNSSMEICLSYRVTMQCSPAMYVMLRKGQETAWEIFLIYIRMFPRVPVSLG